MIGRSYAKKGDSENSKRYMDQLINEYPDEPMARKASNFKRRLRQKSEATQFSINASSQEYNHLNSDFVIRTSF